jgi:hypothetical protein
MNNKGVRSTAIRISAGRSQMARVRYPPGMGNVVPWNPVCLTPVRLKMRMKYRGKVSNISGRITQLAVRTETRAKEWSIHVSRQRAFNFGAR